MDDSSRSELRELAEWRPERGVISVYLDIDPADRGGGWRIELEQGLKRIVEEAEPGKDRAAAAAAAERILARFPQDAPHRTGRAHVGFAEVGDGGRDAWRRFQAGLGDSLVTRSEAPCLAPLVRILEPWRSSVSVCSSRSCACSTAPSTAPAMCSNRVSVRAGARMRTSVSRPCARSEIASRSSAAATRAARITSRRKPPPADEPSSLRASMLLPVAPKTRARNHGAAGGGAV